MNRLRVGDQVVVTAGNHKGEKGKIQRIDLEGGRVIVEGVNLKKRHMRATPQQAGGIVRIPAPIAISNVALLDPSTGKATRVRAQVKDGSKVRVAKSGAVIQAPEQGQPDRASAGEQG